MCLRLNIKDLMFGGFRRRSLVDFANNVSSQQDFGGPLTRRRDSIDPDCDLYTRGVWGSKSSWTFVYIQQKMFRK